MHDRVALDARSRKRIAIVSMAVKLGDETRGSTRFRALSEMLVDAGFDVDLITSSFQHWYKAQRDTSRECYQGLPYSIVFIDEPGYTKNLDLVRIHSHSIAAKNLERYFTEHAKDYALIYAAIPPNNIARICGEAANKQGIPFVVDVNDLWPEAMRMVFNIPILSDIVFWPFARDARRTYQLISGAVGTSDEYAARPAQDRTEPYLRETVYVSNNLEAFDAGAQKFRSEIDKPADEIWAIYTGTLGASYDIPTLIRAAKLLEDERTASLPHLRVKVLGDGPDRQKFEALAHELQAPVDFLGYQDYEHMAAWLVASDITVNSLIASAAQSIVTKISDYLASGKPMINTGSSHEFRTKVTTDGFGLNVEAENPSALAEALGKLAYNPSLRKIMGAKARSIAETQFDQRQSYRRIIGLIRKLI